MMFDSYLASETAEGFWHVLGNKQFYFFSSFIHFGWSVMI